MTVPDRIFAWPSSYMPQGVTLAGGPTSTENEYILKSASDAQIAAAVQAALDGVTTLHTVIADIRAATVGTKPMLADLPAALVAWRDEAVQAEREACAWTATSFLIGDPKQGIPLRSPMASEVADAIRARKEGAG